MNSVVVFTVFLACVIALSIFATYMDKRNERQSTASE